MLPSEAERTTPCTARERDEVKWARWLVTHDCERYRRRRRALENGSVSQFVTVKCLGFGGGVSVGMIGLTFHY